MTAYVPDRTVDEVPIPEACRRLEEAGATVVGINCGRGPSVMLPLLRELRKACKVITQASYALNRQYRHNCLKREYFNNASSPLNWL